MLGGRFAVNGGLPGQPGEVCYWGPDTLAWTVLRAGYSQFARMVLGGGLAGFYQDLRWPGWQDEDRWPTRHPGTDLNDLKNRLTAPGSLSRVIPETREAESSGISVAGASEEIPDSSLRSLPE